MKNKNGYVNFEFDNNGIGTIEFHHPKSNSLPRSILKKLAKTISLASNNKNIKIIILKSNGNKAFCAGASFNELISIKNQKDSLNFFSGFASVINACRKCPKIIIGRIQGKAVGGGVGIASAVDYCFATKNASIRLSELDIGIGPFVVGPSVKRKIGVSAMISLSLNSDKWFKAKWAYQKGLYNEIFEDSFKMDKTINIFAKRLSLSSQEAINKLKKTFWEGTENWDDLLMKRAEISGKLILSEYSKEVLKKIQNK